MWHEIAFVAVILLTIADFVYVIFFRRDYLVEAYHEEVRKEREKEDAENNS